MRRAASILLSILLGALAVGIGMAFFLKQANEDREHLADLASHARREANAAQEAAQQTIKTANQKLAAANEEIFKAQQMMTGLREEKELLATAIRPTLPSPRVQKTWVEQVLPEFGVAVKRPIFAATTWPGYIGAYEDKTFRETVARVSATSSRIYAVDGRVLEGVRGLGTDGIGITILRVRSNGQFTHLLWIALDEKTTEHILATLDFKK